MYIIADLSHLLQPPHSYSTYTMSLCNLGIMGTKYEHNEPPPTEITLEKGSTKTFDISHITSTLTIGNTLQINIRQRSGFQHSFVTLSNNADSTTVIIDGNGLSIGYYEL